MIKLTRSLTEVFEDLDEELEGFSSPRLYSSVMVGNWFKVVGIVCRALANVMVKERGSMGLMSSPGWNQVRAPRLTGVFTFRIAGVEFEIT